MSRLPDRSNFYASIDTRLQPEDVARLYGPPEWRVRKCSLADFEAHSDFAKVVIESGDPALVHGPVAHAAVNGPKVVEPLVIAGLSGTFECYDEAGALLIEKCFGG